MNVPCISYDEHPNYVGTSKDSVSNTPHPKCIINKKEKQNEKS